MLAIRLNWVTKLLSPSKVCMSQNILRKKNFASTGLDRIWMTATMIQTAGKPSKRLKHIRGPSAPEDAVYIHAHTLPNPYKHIMELHGSRSSSRKALEEVKHFLQTNCPDKLNKMIEKGKGAINAKKLLVILCSHGIHRSRAVAELIGDCFHPSRVYYVHRECLKSLPDPYQS